MPLIPKAPAPPDREGFTVRLDRALFDQLVKYAELVEGSKDYVITAALERLFKADREFAVWVKARVHSAAAPPISEPFAAPDPTPGRARAANAGQPSKAAAASTSPADRV
jgi:hypothetical protein